jgi:hypothetical protein
MVTGEHVRKYWCIFMDTEPLVNKLCTRIGVALQFVGTWPWSVPAEDHVQDEQVLNALRGDGLC